MKNFRIGVRLAMGFGLLIAFSLVMLACGIYQLSSINKQTREMVSVPLEKERLVTDWYGVINASISRSTAVARSTDNSLTELFAAAIDYLDTLRALRDHQRSVINNTADYIDRSTSNSYMVLGSIGLLIALIGSLLAWTFTRGVVLPLNQAVHAAQTVAAADLTLDMNPTGRDESAQLLHALQNMTTRLRSIVSNVRQGANAIAGASSQIAAGNLDLSSRTEEQASALQETAASVEQLTSTVRMSADNAQQASQLAQNTARQAQTGGELVTQVVRTMNDIDSSSKKIVDIISVIDGIAFQTNILALNAAVEAARAGEQGRGFAVVAGEVRTLAQRSAQAAKEIKTLIDHSVQTVESGNRLVEQTGAAIGEIVGGVNKVSELVSEISTAGQEQTIGIEQINTAIAQLEQTTQQSATLVEQAAAATQSMQQQAEQLAEAVGIFRVADADGKHRGPSPSTHQFSPPLLGHASPSSLSPVA